MSSQYINYSGGAKGSDTYWENVGSVFGVKTISYSFKGHGTRSKNAKTLTEEELEEGWKHVNKAAKVLKRDLNGISDYVKNLLSRNWFQIKNTKVVYAVGYIIAPNKKGFRHTNKAGFDIVDGGTGYAVMMAIQNYIPVYVFDQERDHWYKWTGEGFNKCGTVTKIVDPNFTGIGTRELKENGKKAILDLYEKTFKK